MCGYSNYHSRSTGNDRRVDDHGTLESLHATVSGVESRSTNVRCFVNWWLIGTGHTNCNVQCAIYNKREFALLV